MPCNAAISITRAAVTQQQLLEVLTDEKVMAVVGQFLQESYAAHHPQVIAVPGGGVQVSIGGITLTICNGVVTASVPPRAAAQTSGLFDALVADVRDLVARLADRLFEERVQQALMQLGPVTTTVGMTEARQPVRAVVFTLRV